MKDSQIENSYEQQKIKKLINPFSYPTECPVSGCKKNTKSKSGMLKHLKDKHENSE
jgi:hypothetical protein